MIKFYLPNFYQQPFQKINIKLITILNNHPEYFYENISIGGIYGCFPSQNWNGGRLIQGSKTSLEDIIKTFNTYEQLNIPLRLTCTNCCLKEEHLKSSYDNLILTLGQNSKNEIIINSPILEKYLREKYPNYKYISSISKCIYNIDDIKMISQNYDLTVLDLSKNNDYDFLTTINPSQFEILLNSYCIDNCPNMINHYKDVSMNQLYNTPYKKNTCNYATTFTECSKRKHFITKENLYNKYIPLGYKHFKLDGRTCHIVTVIESYIYYMVKTEFQNIVREELLKTLI